MVFHGILGDIYTERMQIEEAVAHYDEIIKIDPDFVYAYYKKGVAQKLMLRMVEDAIKSFEKCLELGYHDAYVYYNLGDIYFNLELYAEALTHYSKALELKPDSAIILTRLAHMYYEVGQTERAEESKVK
jgi:tetratricopeptide (TPR) repeat protein